MHAEWLLLVLRLEQAQVALYEHQSCGFGGVLVGVQVRGGGAAACTAGGDSPGSVCFNGGFGHLQGSGW